MMQKKAPSWTIGGRKFYTHQEVTPGPGSYSIDSALSKISASVGRSSREAFDKGPQAPGPGSYSPVKPLPFNGSTR